MVHTKHDSTFLTALIFLVLIYSGEIVAQEDTAATPDSSEQTWFVIETRHRLHPNFLQIDTVAPGDPFYLGEDELEARVILFNPHLGITMEGEALQMSDTLYNPAVQVRVIDEGEVSQESWAFYYTEAPHYRREDMLGFRIIDFRVDAAYIPIPDKK